MSAIFGFVMYGISDPADQTFTFPVLYTDKEIAAATLTAAIALYPALAELSSCRVLPIVAKLPGINWTADPRNPVGSDGTATITLYEDDLGSLGQLFLKDDAAKKWGFEVNTITEADTFLQVVNSPAPAERVYYMGNEAVEVTGVGAVGAFTTTNEISFARAQCGSFARVHKLRPSNYSAGESGSADRIALCEKPNFDEGFYCGVYCFLLNPDGSIKNYLLRRGVVMGDPTPNGDTYSVQMKFLEDHLSQHMVGDVSKETTLTRKIKALTIVQLPGGKLKPVDVEMYMSLKEAEAFFNEPLAPRNSDLISTAMVADLDTRIKADPSIDYQIKIVHGDTWVFKIVKLVRFSFGYATTNAPGDYCVKLTCTLVEGGMSENATITG